MADDLPWSLSPGPLGAVGLAALLYARRWHQARSQAGGRGAPAARAAAFAAGLALVLAAIVSPLDALAHRSFAAHMLQHVLLLDLAAIALIVGLTKPLLRPATRRLQRLEHAAGPLAHPGFAVVFYIGVMVAWHVPTLYDAALRHPALHAVEHVSFASAGLLYWWHLLSPIRSRRRLGGLGPVAYMAVTKLGVGLLGIVLTFSPAVLYDAYREGPRPGGLSALVDQNVGGALMALEQSLIMGAALAVLFIRVLAESEAEEQRAERYGA